MISCSIAHLQLEAPRMIQIKKFIFLYPIPEKIDLEIKNYCYPEKGSIETFRKKYSDILNQCIDVRYRQEGFEINYLVFEGSPVSNIIDLRITDKIIGAGIDFETHATKKIYPDQNYILNQLSEARTLRIAGFYLWDCVERLAQRAYERGLDILVDEDLTEFFASRIKDPNFKIDQYPSYEARKKTGSMFGVFMEKRKQRPWLWQNY